MSDATVFLIDDDASVRDSLSLLLSLKGIRTQPFAAAEAFLETYRPEWRGCVLTDLQMPGMSGLDLQQALHHRGILLPVVVLTAHGDVRTTRLAMKNGAFDFLEKPVNDEILLDILTNAVEGLSQREVAGRLEISPRTVEVYKARMMEKLQCRSFAELIRASLAASGAGPPNT